MKKIIRTTILICMVISAVGCLGNNKTHSQKSEDIFLSSDKIQRESDLTVGGCIFKVYSLKIELTEEPDEAKLYLNREMTGEGLNPTSVLKNTVEFDKNILIRNDSSENEIAVKITKKNGETEKRYYVLSSAP